MAKEAKPRVVTRLMCVRGLLKGGNALNDHDIERILTEMEYRRNMRQKNGQWMHEDAAAQAEAQKISKALSAAARVERNNAKRNRLVYYRIHADIEKLGGWMRGAEAVVGSTNQRLERGKYSVNGIMGATEGKYLGGMLNELKQTKLLDYISSKWLGTGKGIQDDNVMIELWELTREGGEPGSTKVKEAKEIAAIIHKYQEMARLEQNALGANIARTPGYIVTQSHDMVRIANAKFEGWYSHIKGLLDDKTYENIGLTGDAATDGLKIKEFLGRIYNELSTGMYYRADNSDGPLMAFTGPGNLAKRISAGRVLKFKDAVSFIKYNDAFGSASLIDSLSFGFRHAARNIALLERLGTNPRAMMERIVQDLRQRAVSVTDEKLLPKSERNALNNPNSRLNQMINLADGTADIPASATFAGYAANLRAWQNMAKLGGAVLSSFQDVVTGAYAIKSQTGDNLLTAIFKQMSAMLSQFGDEGERRQAAFLVGVGYENILRDITGRLTNSDPTGRLTSRMSNFYFKANALEGFTMAGERGISSILSANLAHNRGKGFDALLPSLKQTLITHGITSRDWDFIRQHGVFKLDDTHYMDPAMLRDIPEEALKNVTRVEQLGQGRLELPIDKAELERKLRTYFVDRTHMGVLRAGLRERSYVTQGYQRGTVAGEAIRAAMLFKTYGISYVQKILGDITGEDRFFRIPGSLVMGPVNEKMQFAQMTVALMVTGYIGNMMKDIAAGKTPQDPRYAATWEKTFAMSGALGTYSDFIFAQYNRFSGAGDVVYGPALGAPTDVYTLYLASRNWALGIDQPAHPRPGKVPEPVHLAWDFVKSNSPFINLFYTRAAMDYLVLSHINELMSPGYSRRRQKMMREQTGQQYVFQ